MCEIELLCAKQEGRELYRGLLTPQSHLAYREKCCVEWAAEDAADAARLQREHDTSRRTGTSFKASAGVSRSSDLVTPRPKDGIQPTTSAGNLYPSLDGNKQADSGHSGSSVLSAAAEVFLPNDADFVSKLASRARQHTRAMKAHADPQKATLTNVFWPPDVQVDADPATPEAT
jgi:hypothetical protein